jgi:hypothetical protein
MFGALDVNQYATLEYHLTLSNGRGPYATYLDLDRNKAIGGRLKFDYQRLGYLSVGTSVYYGSYTSAVRAEGQGSGPPEQIVSQFDEVGIAADVKWEWQGFLAQGELVHQQSKYAEGGRYETYFGRPLAADAVRWGAYGLVGARIPKLELMPYIKAERLTSTPIELSVLSWGLNYRPIPELALKLELSHGKHRTLGTVSTATLLGSQVAWAF